MQIMGHQINIKHNFSLLNAEAAVNHEMAFKRVSVSKTIPRTFKSVTISITVSFNDKFGELGTSFQSIETVLFFVLMRLNNIN